MSDYSEAAAGLKTVLEANITGFPGVQVYDIPEKPNSFPAFVILPDTFDPEIVIQGNSFEASLRVIILVCSADNLTGFSDLYDIIDPTESTKSIIAAVRADQTLDGKVDSARVASIDNIGQRQLWGGFYYAADAMIDFIKSVA